MAGFFGFNNDAGGKPVNKLKKYKRKVLCMNNELENVKIDLNDEMAMEEVLRIVQKDERLALPVVKALSYLPQANEAMFTLVKSLRGIGRIHALPYLDADNDEKRKWVLEHGVDNDFDPCLNAIASCICLGNLPKLLENEKTYCCAARMVEKMLEDEMILELDDGIDVIKGYVKFSRIHAREDWQLLALLKAAWLLRENGEDVCLPEIPLRLLHDNETFKMALDIGIDVQDEMLDRIAADFTQSSELFELLDAPHLALAKEIVLGDVQCEDMAPVLMARAMLERCSETGYIS